MEIQTNHIPSDLRQRSGKNDYNFGADSTPTNNSEFFSRLKGSLGDKNFVDLIQNAEIRNKNASYIIGGRMFEAVVDVNGGGDFKSIQEAIDGGKNRIFVRDGAYYVNSPITFDLTAGGAQVVIQGENYVSIQPSANIDYIFYINVGYPLTPGNFSIDNINCSGSYSGNLVKTGFFVNGSLPASITKCAFSSFSEYGVRVYSPAYFKIDNSVIGGCGINGLNIGYDNLDTSASLSYIKDNIIFSNSEDGIILHGIGKCKILNNNLFNNGSKTDDTYSQILLRYNGLKYSTRNVIAGNVLSSTSANKPKYGIREDSASDDYNQIYGNIVEDSATANVSTQGLNTKTNGDNI